MAEGEQNSLEYWKDLATTREDQIVQLQAQLKKKNEEILLLQSELRALREDRSPVKGLHSSPSRNSLGGSNSLAKLLRKKNMEPVKPKAQQKPPPPPPRTNRASQQIKNDNQIEQSVLCYVHCYGKEPSLSCYYIGREKLLSEHIKVLCKKFQVQNWENYCLQDTSTRHYISPEEFDYYKLQEESMLSLKLHPTYATTSMLNELRNSTELATKKKILFQLRIKLINEEDQEFGEEFIKQGGLQCVLPHLDPALPPSFTSLVLTCLSALMGIQTFDWNLMNSEILDKISTCIASPNNNVQQSALLTMTRVTYHIDNDILLKVEESLRNVLSSPYSLLVSLLKKGEINTQTNALSLINGVLYAASFCTYEFRMYFESKFDNERISDSLKVQLNVPNDDFRRQFHIFQILKMESFSEYFIPFSIEYPDHMALLETLWSAGVDEPFEGPISEMWTQFGFKSSDPMLQLAPTVLYIKNIIYIHLKEGDKFRAKIGKGNLLPIASSSIGITNILCDIFGFGEQIQTESGNRHIYRMLLTDSLANVFGEIHYLVICLMENTWKTLKSPTMEDLSALFGMMQTTIIEALNEDPETILQFGTRIKQIVEHAMGLDDPKGKKKKIPKKKIARRKFKIFHQSLDEIMKAERLENPSAVVPSVLVTLIDSIKTLNGFNLEGIFRISVKMDVLENLKIKLDQGYYDMEFLNAHYPAALLKLWLRELTSPLIPINYYQSCVDNAENFEEIQKILVKIPEINLAVLSHLVKFLHELGLPNNATKTKMGYPNLSLVFGPAILTPPDPATRIINAERERIFVEGLIINAEQMNVILKFF